MSLVSGVQGLGQMAFPSSSQALPISAQTVSYLGGGTSQPVTMGMSVTAGVARQAMQPNMNVMSTLTSLGVSMKSGSIEYNRKASYH